MVAIDAPSFILQIGIAFCSAGFYGVSQFRLTRLMKSPENGVLFLVMLILIGYLFIAVGLAGKLSTFV